GRWGRCSCGGSCRGAWDAYRARAGREMLRATRASSSFRGRRARTAGARLCLCVSCDLRMHGPEVGTCKCFIDDGLDAIITESAHERVGGGELPKAVNPRGLGDGAPPDQQREPPALASVFGQLGIGDRAPRLDELVVFAGHAAPRSRALA